MTTILITHIILMTISLLLTSGMTVAAVFSHKVHRLLSSFNLYATIAGVGLGGALLTQYPLDMKCAMLFAYVAMFSAAHAYVQKRSHSLAQRPL